MYQLRIAHLYPEQMNIYGDRGNILTLSQRCCWREIAVSVDAIKPGQTVDWTRYDLAFFGGGQDSGQSLIADDFVQRHGADLKAAIDDGLVMLTICGGYQMLGHYFLTHTGEKLPGIGALDLHTVGGEQRLIGNIAIEWTAPHDQRGSTPRTLLGFENHSGRTYLGSGVQALGRVLRGFGNNGDDRSEGAVYRNTHGCYMHGSLLPKNPHFADHLLGLALQRRYGTSSALTPLDDLLETRAHQVMLGRLT
jgi:lipid II isoglutaminyl synthase (glutamine-hydrolysing)